MKEELRLSLLTSTWMLKSTIMTLSVRSTKSHKLREIKRIQIRIQSKEQIGDTPQQKVLFFLLSSLDDQG